MTKSLTLQSNLNIVLLSKYESFFTFFDREFWLAVLEIEIAKRIYNCLKLFNNCKRFQSLLLDFHLIVGILFKIGILFDHKSNLTVKFEYCSFLKIRVSFQLFWLGVLARGPWNWDSKTYLQLLKTLTVENLSSHCYWISIWF